MIEGTGEVRLYLNKVHNRILGNIEHLENSISPNASTISELAFLRIEEREVWDLIAGLL